MKFLLALFSLLANALVVTQSYSQAPAPNNWASVRAAQIARILREAKLVGVFCEGDMGLITCNNFADAIRAHLKSTQLAHDADEDTPTIRVAVSFESSRLIQAFDVPPVLRAMSEVQVKLRQVQAEPGGPVELFMEAACYDHKSKEFLSGLTPVNGLKGFQLLHEAQTAKPNEKDINIAVATLAKDFSAYWSSALKTDMDLHNHN